MLQSPKNLGITWEAIVAEPAIIGGGGIRYNQLLNGDYKRYINDVPKEKASNTDDQIMLDNLFPYPIDQYNPMYPGMLYLRSSDSPQVRLDRTDPMFPHLQPYDKYTADYAFNTYLIYRPKGAMNSTIWVTLSVIDWGWHGIAEFNTTSNKWGLTSGYTTGGGDGIATSFLPQWSGRVVNDQPWVPII